MRPSTDDQECIAAAIRATRPTVSAVEITGFSETEPRWRDPYLANEIASAYTSCLGPTTVAQAVLPSGTPASSSCSVIDDAQATAIYLSAVLADERRLYEAASSVADCARDEELAGTPEGLVITSMRTAGLASLASTGFAQCMVDDLNSTSNPSLETAMSLLADRTFTPGADRTAVSALISRCAEQTALAQLIAATASISPVCAAQLVDTGPQDESTALLGAYLSADVEAGASAVAAVQEWCTANTAG
jgi:hypothetical protein